MHGLPTRHQHGAQPRHHSELAAHVAPAPNVIYVVRGRPGPLDRPPMPSGHPVSWGAITDGTMLEQAVYPFPVFDASCDGDQ